MAEGSFPQGYVTIKSLISKSGAPRQTIHYYLRKGLLPPPERTSRTSALYPPSTIELISLIRSLQLRRRLTLDEIATLFQESAYDPMRIAARAGGGEAPVTSPRREFLSAAELATAIGPPCAEEWVRTLAREGLLQPVWREGREVFPPTVVETARAIWDGARLGVNPLAFKAWSALAEAAAEKEIAPLTHTLSELPPAPAARTAALFDVFERFVRARRRAVLSTHFLRSSVRHRNLFVGSDQKYVFPSETLLERMGLNREIDRLVRVLDRDHDNLAALKDLSRAYNMRSDWVHLQQVAREILRVDPGNVRALGDLAQALRYQGRPEEAVSLLEPVLKNQSHPLLKVRLARALVSRARQSGEVRQMVESLEEYDRLSEDALRESEADRNLNRRIRVVLALEAMTLTGPLGMRRPSVEEIQRLYDEYQVMKDNRLPVLGKISLARGRLFLTYALYLFREQEEHRDAERLRRELLKGDPHGVLAARVAESGAAPKAVLKKAAPKKAVRPKPAAGKGRPAASKGKTKRRRS
jgi:DNA-binding transcriptional MerR regulator/tetratricopeptide (TPR) repeat protein